MATDSHGAFEVAEVGAEVTDTHCDLQLKRLTVLRGLPDDVCEYFAALQDVPDAVFTKAVNHALRTRNWFPTPAELRVDCDVVATTVAYEPEPQVSDPGVGRKVFLKNPFGEGGITLQLTRDWSFDCTACEDTGWAPRQCPESYCGRKRRDHPAHPWVERCACLDTNPTLRRRREANAKFSQSSDRK